MDAVVILIGANRKHFVRAIRDDNGEIIEMLHFSQNDPVLIDDLGLVAIERDLGVAIMACTERENGSYKACDKATAALKKDVARLAARVRKQGIKHLLAKRKVEQDESAQHSAEVDE